MDALYDQGLLRPAEPLSLRQGETVRLILLPRPDAKRWDLSRFPQSAQKENLALATLGLAEWADALEAEDRG